VVFGYLIEAGTKFLVQPKVLRIPRDRLQDLATLSPYVFKGRERKFKETLSKQNDFPFN